MMVGCLGMVVASPIGTPAISFSFGGILPISVAGMEGFPQGGLRETPKADAGLTVVTGSLVSEKRSRSKLLEQQFRV